MDRITIVKSDITKLDTDAVVNAANSRLQAGGGVCGAIFKAAGYHRLQDACNKIGHCDTGSAVITPGFELKAKYIIHAVGPRWLDGNHEEDRQLYKAYTKALELAVENKCSSIAFPLISAGIFGFPTQSYALHTIMHHLHDYGNVRYEMGYACTIAVVLFFIMLICNVLVQKLLRKIG